MLVLSRKKDERIIVQVPASAVERVIEIVVVEIRGDKVRIGLEADRDVTIHREEVAAAIARETATKADDQQQPI
jgi:carbon storage regulator